MILKSGIFRRPCYFFLIPFILMFFQPVFSDDFGKYNPEIPDKIIVYGEYPVIEEIKKGFGSNSERKNHPDVSESQPLIDYSKGGDYKEKALIDALHILSANIFGYNFIFKPGSRLMKTEETFDIKLKGRIDKDAVAKVAEGVFDKVYRVKIEFNVTPSVKKWISAFHSYNLKLADAEGTSEFFQGWGGRQEAYHNALRNLVLVEAKRQLSSKPLLIKGDILLEGNPKFNVGAGRYYCHLKGWVNMVEVVTYD
ncbi:hypothetical protein J7L85_01460 [candidate division WOR-3 bacterium]|nr:hypothetical protein [candidate division WOR-3 bacterium]